MNNEVLRHYIREYKINFEGISHQEIYKWKAVQCFQNHWDIDADDFYHMLNASIRLTENLLKSGQYFPLRMLKYYAEERPEEVRDLFKALYNEEVNLYERIDNFQEGTKRINSEMFPERQTYQDHRAVLVYLALRFPERHFLYKFKMFESYSAKLALAYKPITGRIENIGQFYNQCRLVRHHLAQDQELLRLHQNRIGTDCYIDENLNILTQDFIYAIAKHLNEPIPGTSGEIVIEEEESSPATDFSTAQTEMDFQGRMIDFIANSIENKRIGDLGELWVLKYETAKLRTANLGHLISEIKHTAKDEGDGTGYDLRSFDKNGDRIYIEVKTTKGDKTTPFYITRTELERSKVEKEAYFLYRVHDYCEEPENAQLFILQGDLSTLCTQPELYKIKPKL